MKISDLRKWSKEHLSDRQLTLILSFVIGLFASVAGFVLHSIIKEIQQLLTAGFDTTTFNWLYLLFPIVGIYLTSLFIKYVVKDNISHGITRVLYAIATKRSQLKAHNCLGRLFKMEPRTVMLLVGCGASAAIAGIFKAPIAGLVFTLEVLMLDLTMASLLPILIASVTATCFSYIFVGSDSLFTYHMDMAWDIQRVPPYIILGVFCGLVGLIACVQ